MLSTTARKVREMMGRGDLEWTQLRINGRLLIPVESIVGYMKRQIGSHGDLLLRLIRLIK